MSLLPEARMVLDASGTWKLFVLTGYEPRDWLAYSFNRAEPVPTVPERVAVLAALGYEARGGAEWKWDATTGTRRRMFAKIPVRPVADRSAATPRAGAA
ncbi:DUF6303 family protein [Streptomyces anulatus]|uniref:DUF6303 family protein n=1 Tax=Streptomyces anulatus TaxID=1892 RepID=UPI0037B7EF7B|nr:DUF6303 family protein [Streptomyces anulatus]WTE04863.1 DUF6303 family protein [Streptomyces anulatus]